MSTSPPATFELVPTKNFSGVAAGSFSGIKWQWLKKPVPKWVALVSGHMDQNLRFAPPLEFGATPILQEAQWFWGPSPPLSFGATPKLRTFGLGFQRVLEAIEEPIELGIPRKPA